MRHRSLGASVLASALMLPLAVAAESPAEIARRLDSTSLDLAHAVALKGVSIVLGAARLDVDDGILVPLTPVAERPAEMVFSGRARFFLDTTDPIEERQVEIFTGAGQLREPVTSAVLVVPGNEAAEHLLKREPLAPGERSEELDRARATYEIWKGGAERRGFGVDTILLRDALSDPLAESFVAVWCRSPRFDFFFTFDPEDAEPMRVGRFVPVELGDVEQDSAKADLRRIQRKGRALSARIEDLGDWDTWVSVAPEGEDGRPRPGSPGIEPVKYTLEVEIDSDLESLRGKARLTVRIEHSGIRTLSLDLYDDLKVTSVRDGDGRVLFYRRDNRALKVFLPEALAEGQPFEVEIQYAGKAFSKIRAQITDLDSPLNWYPHCGSVDRAIYDVTLRWPSKVDLVGSGIVVESGRDGSTRWEHRRLDVPASGFSFEVGDYKYAREQVGHVAVTLAFVEGERAPGPEIREEVRETVVEALKFYEETFGPYPLDTLTVASVPPRGFSQGLLSFVTLDTDLLVEPRGWIIYLRNGPRLPEENRRDLRRRITAHELAHQWWGNKLGWRSYRDQWLSEALAEYSAIRFDSQRQGTKAVSLQAWAQGRKEALAEPAGNGQPVESLGPVVVGRRLNSSLSDVAYHRIVYDKGALVFSMLAKTIGEKPFADALRTLVDRAHGGVIDTGGFLHEIETISKKDLRGFAWRFVYGTGLPELFYTYEVAPGEAGGVTVHGRVREVPGWSSKYRLEKEPGGEWRLAREFKVDPELTNVEWVIPFQMTVEGSPEREDGRASAKTQQGLGGNMRLRGMPATFDVKVPKKPSGFWLDQREELPAYFIAEDRTPKGSLSRLGERLVGHGDGTDAEKTFRAALAAPYRAADSSPAPGVSKRDEERAAEREDARIHLELADLFLDRRRDGEVLAELEAAERLLTGSDSGMYSDRRKDIRSRLELLAGEMDSVYRRWEKSLYLRFVQREGESTGASLRRMKFEGGEWGSGIEYAMLAVAAHATRNEPVCEKARKEAAKQGIDVSALDALHALLRERAGAAAGRSDCVQLCCLR
jgi:hypothetical protein